MFARAEQRGGNGEPVIILERLDRDAGGNLAVQGHFDNVVRGDGLQRRCGLAQRHHIVTVAPRFGLGRIGQLQHFERARTIGQAAQEAAFLERADQPVDARFRLEAQRLLHFLERRRDAAGVEPFLDEVEQFMLLRGQHRSFSMMALPDIRGTIVEQTGTCQAIAI